MRRTLLWIAILLVGACVERALDGTTSPTSIVDLAAADLRGADLASVDLASIKPALDLAAPVDLASTGQVGVPCSDAICTAGEICCGLAGVMASKCFPTGPMGGGCPFADGGYRCDGPEDCAAGQRCYGRDVSFGGTPAQTRCRSNAGPAALVVCHVDGDCPQGGTCSSVPSVQPGAPPLKVCK